MERVDQVERAVRYPIVGVMGSHTNAHADRSEQLGEWLARQGYHLLTGGGDGVMRAVTQAFVKVPERLGLALAVIPAVTENLRSAPQPGYPNPWVEVPIYTHLDRGGPVGDEPTSRNHLNVLTSTVVILLPGGLGTVSEARLALRYERPCVAFLRTNEELPGIPDDIPIESDFSRVAAFVTRYAKTPMTRPFTS